MTLLASVEDFKMITGLTDEQIDNDRVTGLLGLASSAILPFCHGQEILEGTSTDVTVYNYEGVFLLPQRPVTAVTSVTVDGELIDPELYRWTPGGNRKPAKLIRRVSGVDSYWLCAEAVVDYAHGTETAPGTVVACVVSMVKHLIDTGGGPRALQRTEGPFSASFADEGHSAAMAVPGPVKSTLDRVFGLDGYASVPILRG